MQIPLRYFKCSRSIYLWLLKLQLLFLLPIEIFHIYLLDLFTLFQLSLFIYDQGKATGYFTCSPGKLWQTIEFVFSSLLILNFAVKYFLSILSEIVNPRQIRRLTTGLLKSLDQRASKYSLQNFSENRTEQQNTIILHFILSVDNKMSNQTRWHHYTTLMTDIVTKC